MHFVEFFIGNNKNAKLQGPYIAPYIVLGSAQKLLKVGAGPDVRGYGLTVSDMKDKVLLVADLTGETVGNVVMPSKKPVYRAPIPPIPEEYWEREEVKAFTEEDVAAIEAASKIVLTGDRLKAIAFRMRYMTVMQTKKREKKIRNKK